MTIFAYPVLISRTSEGELNKIYCPDLQFEIPLPNELNNESKLITYINNSLQQHINSQIDQGVPLKLPSDLKDRLSNPSNFNHQDIWTNSHVDVPVRKGCFETVMPWIGKVNVIIFAFLLSIASYFAAKITTKSITLAVIGTVFRIIMSFITYLYADTAGMTGAIGRKIDNCCSSNAQIFEPANDRNDNQHLSCAQSTFKIMSKLIVGSTPFIAAAMIANSNYQENFALADKIQSSEGETAALILRIVAISLAINTAYLNLTFFGSFIPLVFKDIDKITTKLNCAQIDIGERRNLLKAVVDDTNLHPNSPAP